MARTTGFADVGGARIAYQVTGNGPIDLVSTPGSFVSASIGGEWEQRTPSPSTPSSTSNRMPRRRSRSWTPWDRSERRSWPGTTLAR